MTAVTLSLTPDDDPNPTVSPVELTDSSIKCIDCGLDFIWTGGEQKFFFEKGLTNPPKRCKPCKKAKNDRIEAVNNASPGERPHISVKVTCASCGVATTVPFYPSQGRPVLCRDCFKSKSAPPSE